MAALFLKMVNMSISASWLVLAVIVLRFLLKKAPKWLNPILWGIVGLRLLMPFSIESALSLIPSTETIDTARYATRPYVESGIRIVDRPVNEYLGNHYVEGVTVPENNFFDISTILGFLWLIGVTALLIYTFISYYRLRKKVETAVLLRDNVYQSENVVSPFVLGVWRPRIYLPFQIAERDLPHVIAHEQTHIRRHDHWMKPFGFLLLSLYWFNPVLWVAYILLCRDIELACDERVIRELGVEQRADYSQALLNCSVSHRTIAACPLAFGESGVKERVKNVLNYKKPAFWIILAAIVSCIAAAVCFLTDPFEKEAADPAAILGKTYSIGRIVYTDGSELPIGENEKTPDYHISEEGKLFTNEGGEWNFGCMVSEIYLTRDNFDSCFLKKEGWDKGTAGGLRRTNEKAWQAVNEEEDIFYYILLQENGDLYLTRGNESEIQWVFQLGHAFVAEEEKSWNFGYMGYSGYMDECTTWSGNPFKYCDLDNDGVPDRVYRQVTEHGDYAHYRIEFGNGDVLDVPKDASDDEIPHFVGFDLTNDGDDEILWYLTSWMSNEPRAYGQLALFQKVNGRYEEMALPFTESEESYEQKIQAFYKPLREREIEVSIPVFGYSHVAAIDEELWENLAYKSLYAKEREEWHTVWDYDVIDTLEGYRLVCKVHLFDKWSTFGLDITLDYSDGAFLIGDIEFLEDEFKGIDDPFHVQEEVRVTSVTAEGQLGEDAYHYSQTYPLDAFAAETIAYETTADVTHDGKDDLIQLVIYHEESEKNAKKLLENPANVACVKVYRGIDRKNHEKDPRFISRMFGMAHNRNGNVFLSHKNGLDYLLFSSTYESQGRADYSYTVLYISDETGITAADSGQAEFEITDKIPEKLYSGNILREFKENISPWIEDASVLLTLNADRDVQVAVNGKTIAAQSFFDTVLKVDTDIEAWYTDEELCQMAKEYYAAHSNGESEPQYIEISEGQQTGEVDIWLYDIVAGMGRTRARYTVDKITAKGYDAVLFNDIDLTEVIEKIPAIASYPVGGHYERDSKLGEPDNVIPLDEENVIANKGYFVKAEYEGLTVTYHTESDFTLNPRSYVISMTASSDAYTASEGMRVGMSKEKLMQKYSLDEKDFLNGKENEAQYRLRHDGVTEHDIPEYDSFYATDHGDSPVVLIYLLKDDRVNAILLRHLTAD